MHWNYRVVRRDNELAIYEAYYNGDDAPHSISQDPVTPTGESTDDLRNALELMMEALTSPTLEYSSFARAKT